MKSSKNKMPLILLSLLMSSCQSATVFNLNTLSSRSDLHIIRVNSNRVQQKCLFLNAEEENQWRHQYQMYVLNDKNEVLEILQPTNQDRDSCSSQIEKIDKILKAERQVKICIRNKMKKNTQTTSTKFFQSDSSESYKISYNSFSLDSICNAKKCFSNQDIWVDTCTGY